MKKFLSLTLILSFIFANAPVLSGISEGFRIIILTVVTAGAAAFIRPVEEE